MTLETPPDPDRENSFLNIRVADIQAVYAVAPVIRSSRDRAVVEDDHRARRHGRIASPEVRRKGGP